MKNLRVAVYGTLRRGQRNNPTLSGSKYLGSFESNPEYRMCSINNNFPAIQRGGNTSIFLEVFEMEFKLLSRIDELEGFFKANCDNNLYNRKIIETPWGKSIIYLYNRDFLKENQIIISGNWVEFLKQEKIKEYA